MRRCIGTIYLSEHNADVLTTLYYQTHSKSISQALDQAFSHYSRLLTQQEKYIEDIKQLREQLNVLNTVIIQYKNKIINASDIIEPTTTTTSTSSSYGR